MKLVEVADDASKQVDSSFVATLAGVGLLVTFLHLFTAWFENIYRMSLIKLEMGAEIAGVLLPLLVPTAVWLMARSGLVGMRLAVLGYLLIYGLVWWPPTTPVATIVLGGLGVALGLGIAAHGLSGLWGAQVDGVGVVVLATSLLVVLRTWGYSLDPYAAGAAWGLLPGLLLLPLFALTPAFSRCAPEQPRAASALAVVGLFGSLGFVYLVLSVPDAVDAWTGVTSSQFRFDLLLWPTWLLLVIGDRMHFTQSRIYSQLRLLGVVFFCGHIVGFIFQCGVDIPQAVGDVHVVSRGLSGAIAPELILLSICIWSVALYLNCGALLYNLAGQPVMRLAWLFVLGIYVVVLVAMLLVFTNVWGYVGAIGLALRNQFAVPFIVCAVAVVVPTWLLRRRLVQATPTSFPAYIVLAALALVVYLLDFRAVAVPEVSGDTFTVLTYNIQQGSREDGDQAYVAQAEFIRKVNPDIVALQESDTARPSGGFVNTATYFGRSLGYHSYYGPTTISGTFGTAVLSRFPIRDARSIYTYSDTDEVGTAVIDVVIGEKTVRIYNNHPAGSEDVMNAHASMLVGEVKRGGSVVATGDFNSRPDEAPYAAIAAVLTDAWASRNPTGTGPGFSLESMRIAGEVDMKRRIDHVFVSREFEVLDAFYVLPPDSETDHPAHWARLRIR